MLQRWMKWILLLAAVAGSPPAAAQVDRTPSPDPQQLIDIGVWQPGEGLRQIPLWPAGTTIARPELDGPETTVKGTRLVGGRIWQAIRNVAVPTMTLYPPKGTNTGAAMLVLPGGGYEVVAIDLEGSEICDWVTARGMTCILLKYRVPQRWHPTRDRERAPKVQLPLQDAQRAMVLMRQQAMTLGVDPHRIGVIGFSAGGHLAAALSNADARGYPAVDAADTLPSRPDFAVLLYPGHLHDSAQGRRSTRIAPWLKISPKAPPTFLLHSVGDPTDSVYQSFAYAMALEQAGVPLEMHLYAAGGHAFGLRPSAAAITSSWPGLIETWLHSISVLGTTAPSGSGE